MKLRMGRPPKSGDTPMGDRLEIRLLPGEKAAYTQAAEAAGLKLSDWIRAKLNAAAKRTVKR
jgi:uncharacterized protein (DUF1778 family)